MSNDQWNTRPIPGRGAKFKSLVDRSNTVSRLNSILEDTFEETALAIHAAAMGGLGVLIASTSDGGAISVTVYQGDERLRSYAASREEWMAILAALRDAGDAAAVGLKTYGKPPRTAR